MKKLHLILLLTFAIAVPVFAVDDSPASRLQQADRYLAATPPKEMFVDMAEQMAKNMPPDQREMFKSSMTKYLDVEAVTKAMKESMVKNFTTDELKALADFYGSEVGKAAMKKFGIYMADVMPIVQAEAMKAVTKANKDMPDTAKPSPKK